MTDYLQMYNRMFADENYNQHLHTEPRFLFVMDALKRNPLHSLIDIGAGRGLLLDMAHKYNEHTELTAVDLNNYHNLSYVKHINADITESKDRGNITGYYSMLTCLDCLEHIKENYIPDILRMFSTLSEVCIFSIANHSDIIDGVELHLTQKSHIYWTEKLSEFFEITAFEIAYNGNLYLYQCRRKDK